MERRIHYLTILALISKGLVNIFGFFASIILVRILTQDDFGKYAYVSSIGAIAGVVTSLGLTNYFVKELSADSTGAQFRLSNFLGVQIVLAVVVFAMSAVVALLHNDPIYRTGILLFCGGVCLMSPIGPFMGFATAQLRNDLVYWQMILQSILQLILTGVGLWIALPLNYFMAIPLVTGGARLVHAVLDNFRLGWTVTPSFSVSDWRSIFSGGLPFGLLTGLNILYARVDILLFTHLQSSLWTGIYSVSSRLAYVLIILPSILTENLYPLFSQKKADDRSMYFKLLEKYTVLSVAVCLAIAVGGSLLGGDLITLLFGARYLSAKIPFCIYLFLPGLVALYLSAQHFLLASGHVWYLVKSTIGCLLVNIIANAVLLNIYQEHAAMVASASVTLGTEVLYIALCYSGLRRFEMAQFSLRRFATILPPVIVMALWMICIPIHNLFGSIAMGAVVFGAAAWQFGLIEPEDRTAIREYINRRLRGRSFPPAST